MTEFGEFEKEALKTWFGRVGKLENWEKGK
jgi:hypothetical protein